MAEICPSGPISLKWSDGILIIFQCIYVSPYWLSTTKYCPILLSSGTVINLIYNSWMWMVDLVLRQIGGISLHICSRILLCVLAICLNSNYVRGMKLITQLQIMRLPTLPAGPIPHPALPNMPPSRTMTILRWVISIQWIPSLLQVSCFQIHRTWFIPKKLDYMDHQMW